MAATHVETATPPEHSPVVRRATYYPGSTVSWSRSQGSACEPEIYVDGQFSIDLRTTPKFLSREGAAMSEIRPVKMQELVKAALFAKRETILRLGHCLSKNGNNAIQPESHDATIHAKLEQ